MVNSNIVTITVLSPSPTLGSITLQASSTSITAGQSVTFSGLASSTTGTALGGVVLSINVSSSSVGTVTTNSSGAYSMSVVFPTAGTYSVVTSG